MVEIFKFSLLFVWQILQNIIALAMMPFLGEKRVIEYNKDKHCFVIEGEKMSGGISLGSFIYLSRYSAKQKTSIMHELGHVADSHLFGPLYLFVIGLPSILWAVLHTYCKVFSKRCYYSFYTEKRANKNAGVHVVEEQGKCRLSL